MWRASAWSAFSRSSAAPRVRRRWWRNHTRAASRRRRSAPEGRPKRSGVLDERGNDSVRSPRPPERAPRFFAGVLTVFQYLHTVDEDVAHADGVDVRLFVR